MAKRFFSDPDEMEKEIENFFNKNEHHTITGLCLHLGFESRQSFYDYEKNKKFSYIIKRARLKLENFYEKSLFGKNTIAAIFALKQFDWSDKVESKNTMDGKIIIEWADPKNNAG